MSRQGTPPSVTIDGQALEVEPGTTILQVARRNGIYIPTLCFHPYLPLEEACRICVVEDIRGDWSSLVAACVFPARQGMTIETDSPKVLEARRTIMELLLSDHPNDCMTCYATGAVICDDFSGAGGLVGYQFADWPTACYDHGQS